MSRAAGVAWACLCFGCASVAGRTESLPLEHELAFHGVIAPRTVGTFTNTRANRWLDPRLGVSFTYVPESAGPAEEVTIYVYPLPDSPDENFLRAEFEKALADITQYTDRYRDGFEVRLDGEEKVTIVTSTDQPYSGWRAETTLLRNGPSLHSLLLVFAKDGHFIKYRISYPRSLRVLRAPEIDEFLRTSLEQLRIPQARRSNKR